MSIYQKYKNTYKDKPHNHLTRIQAIQQYESLTRMFPDALVEMEQLDCGHWKVVAHKTQAEKDSYTKRKWSDMVTSYTSI